MAVLDYATRAIAQITGAPSPATSGLTLSVSTGQGARFLSGAQTRRVRLYNVATGAVEIATLSNVATDAFTLSARNADGGGAQSIANTGWVIEDINDFGPSQNFAFDIAFFSALGGGSWTPTAGGTTRHSINRFGQMAYYELRTTAGTTAGTVTTLQVAIPSSVGAAAVGPHGGHLCRVNIAGVELACVWSVTAGGTLIQIVKIDGSNFAASAGTVAVIFGAWIELP